MSRTDLLKKIASEIKLDYHRRPLCVAVDGVDASGKTVFADELAAVLRAEFGFELIRASIDGFHNPKAIRFAQGQDSPVGYYQDTFNLEALIYNLLEPLKPGGSLKVRKEIFDLRLDAPIDSPCEKVSPDSILVLDGIFLHRPELKAYWDYSIFLHVPFDTILDRAALRDGYLFGTVEQIRSRYNQKYIPAQLKYLTEVFSTDLATVNIDNSNFENPFVV